MSEEKRVATNWTHLNGVREDDIESMEVAYFTYEPMNSQDPVNRKPSVKVQVLVRFTEEGYKKFLKAKEEDE